MLKKACTICNSEKPIDDFYSNKRGLYGKHSRCKECSRALSREWKSKNKERVSDYNAEWRANNPDKSKEAERTWRLANLERIKERKKIYRAENRELENAAKRDWCRRNPEKKKAADARYRAANKEKVSLGQKAWREKNKERKASNDLNYYLKNKERITSYKKEYSRENKHVINSYRERNRERINNVGKAWYHKVKANPDFAASRALRRVLSNFMRYLEGEKTDRTNSILGYNAEQLKQRLECQFQPGMSWANYGDWHIDHKIPVSHFLRRGESRPHIVNALSNLQPLWAIDNLTKNNRWVG